MFSSDQPAYTHLDDWFRNEHKMNNLVKSPFLATHSEVVFGHR